MSETVTVDRRGRIRLPDRLLEARGWTGDQWFSVEELPGGIRLALIDRPASPEVLRSILAAHLDPLGRGRGEQHTRYVSRWRHSSGAVVVSENSQPNVWLKRDLFEKFDASAFRMAPEMFMPAEERAGFHSNVATTAGLQGEAVVKLRAQSSTEVVEMAENLIDQLESFS